MQTCMLNNLIAGLYRTPPLSINKVNICKQMKRVRTPLAVQSVMVLQPKVRDPVHAMHGQKNFTDTNPLMSSLLVTLVGVVKQICRV
jgi:hypothetical protein